MLRILQVGLGPLGRQVVRDLCQRRLGHVVAAIDVDPELTGRALRQLVPEATAEGGGNVKIGSKLGDLPQADVAIVATSSWLEDCAPTFAALLERKLAVVSTCEELVWPWRKHAARARELDALARARGGRLLGTGVNPGFLMDAWPLMATAVSRDVRGIEIERVQDAAIRRIPFQQKVGLGLSREEFVERTLTGRFGHAGLHESLDFVARTLGFEIGEIEGSLAPLIAEHELASGVGTIAPGRVRGLRETARAATADGRTIALTFEAQVGCEDPRDRVRVLGEPEIDVRITGGVHGDVATTSIVLNSMRSLLDAAPGLHTMVSVPPVRWRRGAE